MSGEELSKIGFAHDVVLISVNSKMKLCSLANNNLESDIYRNETNLNRFIKAE